MQLDPYEDIAAYYDCEHDQFVDDIDFYLEHLTDGPVLEVGAGTGRIMVALLRSGLTVWGVDMSEAMLRRAEIRLAAFPAARLVRGNIDDLPVDLGFPTVILPLNTLWHLPDNDAQIQLLRHIKARMPAHGRLFVDVSNPLSLSDRGAWGTMRERYSGPCEDGSLHVMSTAWDNEAEQRLRLSLTFDVTHRDGWVKRKHTTLVLRYVYRYELDLMLRQAGFSVLEVFGSYTGDPYVTDSPNLIAVAGAD